VQRFGSPIDSRESAARSEAEIEHRVKLEAIGSNSCLVMQEIEKADPLQRDRDARVLKAIDRIEPRIEARSGVANPWGKGAGATHAIELRNLGDHRLKSVGEHQVVIAIALALVLDQRYSAQAVDLSFVSTDPTHVREDGGTRKGDQLGELRVLCLQRHQECVAIGSRLYRPTLLPAFCLQRVSRRVGARGILGPPAARSRQHPGRGDKGGMISAVHRDDI